MLGHQTFAPDMVFGTSKVVGSGATERDIQQTISARKLLSVSPELASLNLIVRCRSGIVTVSGPVHDKAVMNKVTSLLIGLRGVEKIRNEMYVGPLGVRPLPLAAEESHVGLIEVETRRNAMPSSLSASQSTGTLISGSMLIDRKESSVSWKPQPNQAGDSKEIGLAILELIRAESRFAQVRYSLNGGVIILEANVGPEVTMEFAHRLSKIPGVLRVKICQD